MKHALFRLLLAFVFCCMLMPLLVACLAEGEPVRIACIVPQYPESAFWQDIIHNIRQASSDLGVQLTMLYTKHNEPSMTLSLNEALSIATLSDVDAIIASYTLADEETDVLLQTAREQGIAMVMIDCDAPVALRDAYVGIDNEAAGFEIGETALETLGDGKTALLVYGSSSLEHDNLRIRLSGIERAFEAEPQKLTHFPLETGATLQSSLEIAKYIEEHPSIAAVIAINENCTLLCAQLLDRIDPGKEILRCGFDESAETLALIESGSLDMLICQPHGEMGYHSVEVALSLLRSESSSAEEYLIDYVTLRSQ